MLFIKKIKKIKFDYLPCLTKPCIINNEKHIVLFFFLFDIEITLRRK